MYCGPSGYADTSRGHLNSQIRPGAAIAQLQLITTTQENQNYQKVLLIRDY